MRTHILSSLHFRKLQLQRLVLLRKGVATELEPLLTTEIPTLGEEVERVPFLALDFETTGLDPRRDRIVSAGWIRITGASIQLSTGRELVVQPQTALTPESVIIHGIGDDRAAGGVTERDMLSEFLDVLPGKVLVAHHASVETRFLSAALRRVFGSSVPLLTVDTLKLERRIRRSTEGRLPQPVPEEAERFDLTSVRRRYNLPDRRRHSALIDALGCAEILLAQCTYIQKQGSVALARLL